MNTILELSERLLLCRRDMNLTQLELSDRSGVSRSYIAQVERGTVTNIGIEPLMMLAKALGVTVAYLIGETDIATDETDEEEENRLVDTRAEYVVGDAEERLMLRELVSLFQQLHEGDRVFALGLIRRMAAADTPRIIGNG